MEELLCLIALFVILVHVFQFGKKMHVEGVVRNCRRTILQIRHRHSGIGIGLWMKGALGFGIWYNTYSAGGQNAGEGFRTWVQTGDGKFSALLLILLIFAL